MTKEAAIYNFWSGFNIPAYEENTVFAMAKAENAPAYPYITYEINTDDYTDTAMPLSASIWYRSTSWNGINAKKREISEAIGRGGKVLNCDGGYILIQKTHPFAQNMGESSDDMVKRTLLGISVTYYT